MQDYQQQRQGQNDDDGSRRSYHRTISKERRDDHQKESRAANDHLTQRVRAGSPPTDPNGAKKQEQ